MNKNEADDLKMMLNNNNGGEVSKFFKGKSVFITGGTGFMGKVLVWKLLSACPDIKSIYLLIRPKKGILSQDRLDKVIFSTPIFKSWKTDKPELLDKVKSLNGDITLPKLGLSDNDIELLVNEISVVFHSAATVRFDEEISK